MANGLYLLMVAVGGVVYSADRLPAPLDQIVSLLPSAALGQGLRQILLYGEPFPWTQAGVLLVWGAVAGWATVRTFRWR